MKKMVKTSWALLLLVVLGSVQAAEDAKVDASKSFYSKFAANTPIDVNLQVQGVSLNSVYFSQGDRTALAIVQNKTPQVVTPKVGVSLYDSKGNLLAVGEYKKQGVFSSESVKAGEQNNVHLDFSGFVNDFNKVANFKLVFSVTAQQRKSGDGSSGGSGSHGW